MCLVRHVAWYAWAWAGVIPVIKRILLFYTITKVSRILDASTVLMMGINKCVNEAHHHDPILEASQEHLGDQVMEKMVSPWMHSSVSPKRSKHITQTRAFVVMRESRVHSGIQYDTYVHNPQYEIF